jgi:hypothetical protein
VLDHDKAYFQLDACTVYHSTIFNYHQNLVVVNLVVDAPPTKNLSNPYDDPFRSPKLD